MIWLFNTVLIKPLFNTLVGLYNVIPGHDFGVAIIILTLLIRLLLMPLSIKALRSQQAISRLQPKIKELQDKHKHDKAQLAQHTMGLYKQEGVNPLGGCLPILIQLPVILALYQVFIKIFQTESMALLYGFVSVPASINNIAFHFLDLGKPNVILAVLAGVLQFVQSYMMMKLQPPADSSNPAAAMTRQMTYIFPVMIVFIAWSLPASLSLYWVVTTLYSVLEQWYIRRPSKTAVALVK